VLDGTQERADPISFPIVSKQFPGVEQCGLMVWFRWRRWLMAVDRETGAGDEEMFLSNALQFFLLRVV
jgi:hypothetical protein